MTKQSRGRDYYLQRLKKDHPALFREVVGGRMSVNKARQLAGNLGATRTPLHELKNAWQKANLKERRDFIKWMRARLGSASAPTTAHPAPLPAPFDPNGIMAGWVRKRIPEIMFRRGLTAGNLADELGIPRLNVSVMMAVARGTRIRSRALATMVEGWLTANASV